MSTSDKDIEFNLDEQKYTIDSKTEDITVEFKCGPCRDGNHKACRGGCPCALNNHKGL